MMSRTSKLLMSVAVAGVSGLVLKALLRRPGAAAQASLAPERTERTQASPPPSAAPEPPDPSAARFTSEPRPTSH